MTSDERGLSVIEVLIATAIVALVALGGLAACQAIARVTNATYVAGRDAAAVDAQVALLRDDAAGAFAVFVPALDMNGATNVGPLGGHEVDYYARGSGGQDVFWRYFYDPSRQTLQRFDYDPDGAVGVRNTRSGTIDAAAAYPRINGLTAFTARTISADALGDPAQNVYSGVAQLAPAARAYRVSYDRPQFHMPDVAGGNAIVQVTLANSNAARVVHLATAALPTGFTLTGLPRWHAIVYRVDQTHRFLFGFAGKSHVFINARVDVSYDDWQTRITWCDFNLLGAPDGLDPDDPHANYAPNESFEQAESLLARCRGMSPVPPRRDSAGYPAEPGLVTQPLPAAAPPACWSAPGPQGRCWPLDVPPDWSPPSPIPADPPPATWCANHAASAACSRSAPNAAG